jgi:cytochrome c-type biogenesis protein CcmH/NrfG
MSESSPVDRSASTEALPRGRAIRILVVALAIAGLAAVVAWRVGPSSASRRPARPLDVSSPYANTRPEVRCVGDEACARCHAGIAETYRRHPMGRSLSPVGAATADLGDAGDGRPLFRAGGLDYSIERRDGRVFHCEARRDASGRVVARNEAEVRYVLGSGSQGASFLIDRDGFLFQSPISWYARGRRWDLSPGYREDNAHFDRVVLPLCLYCHANRVEAVEGATNRYRPPTFRGHAIGCERCHGPGALHAARPGGAGTIVNPAALESALRDAVCEQCHLIGQQRVLRIDRREDDFRPGLPFTAIWSVFERAEGTGTEKFVGQVEQMHESRCYRASSGRLGCISCHDPHRRPGDEERAGYFRGRCLECHADDRGCRLPEPARRERSREDDCTACHMPRLGDSDIPHLAATDHRIVRQAGDVDRISNDGEGARRSGLPLVPFHREPTDERRRAEAARDLGVALYSLGPAASPAALPLLEAALAARPDDVIAWQAKGGVLGRLGRYAEGLAAFQEALARDPDRESTLVGVAELAALAGRPGDAIAARRRAIAINPWRASYRGALAAHCFQDRDWTGAVAACREAVRLDPFDLEARRLLVRALLRLDQREAARGEFRALLDLDPPDRGELIRRLPALAPP